MRNPAAADVVACTWLHWRGEALLAVRPYAVRRSADDLGPYFLPGGMPEPGETYAEAAAREVREEVGMRVDPAVLTEVVRVTAPAHGRPGATVQLVCFVGAGHGTPEPDLSEIAEITWLEPQQWHQFAVPIQLALAQLAAS